MSKESPRQAQIRRLREANQHNAPFFDKWEDDFDKNFNRMSKAIITMWVVGGIATLAFWIVVVWAIIKLVNHFA